jgi:hypothetical protein
MYKRLDRAHRVMSLVLGVLSAWNSIQSAPEILTAITAGASGPARKMTHANHAPRRKQVNYR